jgi:hypothetical protein
MPLHALLEVLGSLLLAHLRGQPGVEAPVERLLGLITAEVARIASVGSDAQEGVLVNRKERIVRQT